MKNTKPTLITLKTFQRISTLAYHCGYDSTRGVFDEILGKVPTDLSDVTEVNGQEIVKRMEHRLEILKKDKNYKPPKPIEAGHIKSRSFGLEEPKRKKKITVIE